MAPTQKQGSSTHDASLFVSAHHADRYSPYFINAVWSYLQPCTVSVPAGETRLFIKVMPEYLGGTGGFGIRVQ